MAASETTFKMVGDWSKQMDVPIGNALAATVDLTGRSGRQACEMGMVYMARAARARTKQSKKNRKIGTDAYGRHVIVDRTDSMGKLIKIHQWKTQPTAADGPTWEAVKNIRRRGLAKKSWMWGIKGLRGGSSIDTTQERSGVVTLDEQVSDLSCGYIMTNRLPYINKAAPHDVEAQAAASASNQIMAQAAKALERKFGVEVPRLAAQRQKRAERKLAKAWRDAR